MKIFNPDTEDFSISYDINENKDSQIFTIHSLEMKEFPDFLARHIQKHLADHLLHKRGIRLNVEEDLKRIYKEIECVV